MKNNCLLLALLLHAAAFAAAPLQYGGKTYKTVKIGEQTWMAENLNFEAKGSRCYEDKPENCAKYGRLYNWQTAMKVCPKGWHLPSNEEWDALVKTVGGEEVAGKKLKTKSGWNENGNGTDEYGFSALPGGNGDTDEDFVTIGDHGCWWTNYDANDANSEDASIFVIVYDYSGKYRDGYDKMGLFSVRCIKD